MNSFQKPIKTALVLIIFFLASLSNAATAIGAVIRYSTYLGGSGHDIAHAIVATTTGIYITGTTNSTDFPSATGTSTTKKDVFVTKMALTGTTTLFTTRFRGSGNDEGRGIAVDIEGNVYVTGFTDSTDFATTTPGILSTGSRMGTDAFITKISSTGGIIYSTLLGGNKDDEGLSIAVDSGGNAYVTGSTFSDLFPTFTPLPATSCAVGAKSDAFITMVNRTGTVAVYSTCLGGGGDDIGRGIAVDIDANVYVTGFTDSTDLATTTNALQKVPGGLLDAFFTKVAPMGTSTIYSTYLGGTETDAGYGIALNGTDVYITGETNSDTIGTSTVIQDFEAGVAPTGDVFIANIDLATSTAPDDVLAYVVYLGAGKGLGITIDSAGNAYVTGETSSTSFPTAGPTQAINADSSFPFTPDAFVSKINPDGTFLLFSTYLGGNSEDFGKAIAIDADRNVYVTGQTNSANFPKISPLQGSYNGQGDLLITKFDTLANPSAPVPADSGGGGCFIATAAYGSYLDPHVMVLRTFRDRYLSTNAPGRFFVEFYYRHSPPLADYISRHEGIRNIVRWGLTPIIYAIAYPILLPIFMLMIFALLATLCLRPELNRHAPKREGF